MTEKVFRNFLSFNIELFLISLLSLSFSVLNPNSKLKDFLNIYLFVILPPSVLCLELFLVFSVTP